MTPTKRRRKLDEIYVTLPSIACKGLCTASCALAPAYPAEMERLEHAAKRSLPVLHGDELGPAVALARSVQDPTCPLLVAGRCGAYDDRPYICRIFGVVDGMRCPHGCTPERILTRKEVDKSIREISKL